MAGRRLELDIEKCTMCPCRHYSSVIGEMVCGLAEEQLYYYEEDKDGFPSFCPLEKK